jgi:hypothetical protein
MMKVLTLMFALLLICTGAALAQTPDGETPAEETVCDSENGAAFGLCNAYCEAMDCDSDDPQASETACTKVRSKFMNIAGHDLPCEAPPATCPCLGNVFFDYVLASVDVDMCRLNDPNLGTVLRTNEAGSFIDAFANVSGNPQPVCGVFDSDLGPVLTLAITAAEAQACNQLLLDAAAALNLTCQ